MFEWNLRWGGRIFRTSERSTVTETRWVGFLRRALKVTGATSLRTEISTRHPNHAFSYRRREERIVLWRKVHDQEKSVARVGDSRTFRFSPSVQRERQRFSPSVQRERQQNRQCIYYCKKESLTNTNTKLALRAQTQPGSRTIPLHERIGYDRGIS